MCPIVMSTTYGEREGKLSLTSAWEILGGRPCSGICGYIADASLMEDNKEYIALIEKKAENMYRTVNQKIVSLPASNQAIRQMVSKTQIDLTPQESEQLSQYASDDKYVQRQKEDIQELTSLFRDMLNNGETEESGGNHYTFGAAFQTSGWISWSISIYYQWKEKALDNKSRKCKLTMLFWHYRSCRC